MKTKQIVAAGLILALAVGGFFFWRSKKSESNRNRASIQDVTVREGSIERAVEATGEVAPLNRVEIRPPLQGRVERLLVEEGDHVKKGQIIAWLSSSDRAAILDAARAQGEKALKNWEDTYKPTPIIAPLTGVIILRNAIIGQTVDVGTILFAMSDKLIVLTRVDEVDIGRVQVGMRARITLDAFPDQPVYGKVTRILFEGKNVSNVITYGVKVEPEKEPPFFRSQMTANVRLIIEGKDKAVLIPAAAVNTSEEGGTTVMVKGEKGKPQPKPVEVGIINDEDAEIVSGLKPGDQILLVKKKYTPQKGEPGNSLLTRRRPGQSGQGGQGSQGGQGGQGGQSRERSRE